MKKMTLRRMSLCLAILFLLSMAPVAGAYSNMDGWAVGNISAMEELGLIPEELMDADLKTPISRLDMSRIAVLACEALTDAPIELPGEHPFTDTEDPDAEKAFAAGIVNGNGSGLFRPEDALTRLEFFVIVEHFLRAVHYPITEDDYADLSGFSDVDTLPAWGTDYAALTVGLGIVNGDGSGLNWAGTTTCQDALVLFYRTFQKVLDLKEQEAPVFENLAPWAEEAILAMDEMALIPESVRRSLMDGAITRQNLCKVLMCSYRLLTGVTDEILGQPEDVFEDTDDTDVLNAYRLGIVSGRGNGIFAPGDPITRQDFFKMTVNFLNAIGYPFTDDETVDLSSFQDADEIASYALGSARLLVGLGIVNGTTDNRLNPRNNIACQEALLIFWRLFCHVTGWDEIPPTEPSEPTEPPVTEPPATEPPAEPTEPPVTEPPTDPTDPPETEEPPTEPSDGDVPQECLEVVEFAKTLLGCDYTYAGKNPESGFDCSGFVYYVYKQFGYTLNPGATNQWNYLSDEVIPEEELRPGDLVFFSSNGQVSGMTHVGIYIGDGQFIHAENYENGVCITPMDQAYYAQRYLGAKRVIE